MHVCACVHACVCVCAIEREPSGQVNRLVNQKVVCIMVSDL